MSKYNIVPKKEKVRTVAYRNSVSPQFVEKVSREIIMKLAIEQKYRDPNYSAKRLAEDLGINSRYVSAVMFLRFQKSYSQMVLEMRISEAMYMLQEKSYNNMTIEDVAINVGFSSRQNFYVAFYKLNGQTPLEYRLKSNTGYEQ